MPHHVDSVLDFQSLPAEAIGGRARVGCIQWTLGVIQHVVGEQDKSDASAGFHDNTALLATDGRQRCLSRVCALPVW